MAFSDKKAEYAYINSYQKEKYDRITVMSKKREESRISGGSAG